MKPHILFFFLLIVTNGAKAQLTDLVTHDDIVYPLYKNNIGKIVFMEKAFPLETCRAEDLIHSFILKEKTDLNIRVFLDNALTNYLHQLSPQLNAEELTSKGNYQFSFYVDAKKIYVEELNTGAGSAESKNQRTVFRVPLISSTNEDSWGRFLWNRFLMNGGKEALTGGTHELALEVRPYLKTTGLLVGGIIASGSLQIIVPEKKISEKKVVVQKIKPLQDWSISTGTFDTAKIKALNAKIAADDFKDITSIVIIKDGKLLLEEYFNGAGRNTLHDTRSVGKTFASAMLGIAIGDGYIKSETQTLKDFYDLKRFPNYSTAKDSITLKQLLTMSSPFNGSDMDDQSPGNEEKMYPEKNWLSFAMGLPVDRTKVIQHKWDYFTAGVIILGDAINRSVPGGLEKYTDQKLFRPLEIRKYKWQYTPQKVASTAGGIRLRALDLAKFGQLYKNKGIWNGKEILRADWVEKSLSKQVSISNNEFYGYLFWNKTYKTETGDHEVYYCSGNGGNKIVIFKDQPFVIVITSTAYNTPYGHAQVDRIMQHYLIPALILNN